LYVLFFWRERGKSENHCKGGKEGKGKEEKRKRGKEGKRERIIFDFVRTSGFS
jgi:hypothetical protein